MGIIKKLLLLASESKFFRAKLPEVAFIRRAVKRFMPGENLEDAMEAAKSLIVKKIPSVFTHLGENIVSVDDSRRVTEHYIELLEIINRESLRVEISVKLTQLGFDISEDTTYENLKLLILKAAENGNTIWIDMESSKYKGKTIELYKQALNEKLNAGLCLQAYLLETEQDLRDLLKLDSKIRLVKGAYNEPKEIVYSNKRMVDKNYFKLSGIILDKIKSGNMRGIFATHDEQMIKRIQSYARQLKLDNARVEFQMLYGIRPDLQQKLADQGYDMKVLISYGSAWFPWYMRRLAERPANIIFVLKNIFKS